MSSVQVGTKAADGLTLQRVADGWEGDALAHPHGRSGQHQEQYPQPYCQVCCGRGEHGEQGLTALAFTFGAKIRLLIDSLGKKVADRREGDTLTHAHGRSGQHQGQQP